MGTRYTICCWAINRSDPQNLLSVTLDVPLHRPRHGILPKTPSCPKTHPPDRLQHSFQARNHCFEAQQPWRGGKCKGTPNPRLWSNPVADPILLCNIGSYFHHSESTSLPPNALSLFRPWLPMQRHEDTVVYNVDYSLQKPHLIL